ncbi:MAG: hypothetical protein ACI8R4_002482 [Paracoccaceae bacterium]|jgi:hypothetical protein
MRGFRAVIWTTLMICLTAAQPARAGAWLRDPGTGFFSVTNTMRNVAGPSAYETSLYADYGLWPRLSLGLDINERPGITGHAMIFARLPLGQTDRRTRFAMELGVGGSHWKGDWNRMAKSTLSIGHNFTSPWGAGWLNIDAAVEMRSLAPDPIYKLDASFGLASTHRFAPMLQLETTHIRSKPISWALTPSVVFKGRNNLTWLVGVEVKSALQTSLGLKLGLWRQF